jgi:hypothetical protein
MPLKVSLSEAIPKEFPKKIGILSLSSELMPPRVFTGRGMRPSVFGFLNKLKQGTVC